MAFTAHIDSITSTGNGVLIQVTFADSASGFNQSQGFTFPADGTITLQSARQQIIDAGATLKAQVTAANSLANTLQGQVGASITI